MSVPMQGTGPIEAIAVVIPIRNEAELLPRCLASLDTAIHHLDTATGARRMKVVVVLVLDSCDDESAAIAQSSRHATVEVAFGAVGATRATGVATALAILRSHDPSRVWLANSDADSAVPSHWLSHQLALADDGIRLMLGMIRPDLVELDDARRAAWTALYVPGDTRGRIYGANLGVRADTYLAAGGFPPVAEHEDVRLVERIRAMGEPIEADDGCWVLTSARVTGRTPGGYAGFLRDELTA